MCVYNYIEMARVTGVPFNYLLVRGQQIKVRRLHGPAHAAVNVSANLDASDGFRVGASVPVLPQVISQLFRKAMEKDLLIPAMRSEGRAQRQAARGAQTRCIALNVLGSSSRRPSARWACRGG